MTAKLVWLDLETTGLDPTKDRILEVAVSMASFDDPFTVKETYQCVVALSKENHASLDPYILDMHTKNGLLAECEKATASIAGVELELLDLIPSAADKEDAPVLAGSSIHFDRAFIKQWMPQLYKRLSHRLYDVSALKLFCQSMGMPKSPKAEAHRAADDIVESMEHAKACKDWLKENARSFK